MKLHSASEKKVTSQLKNVVVIEKDEGDGKEYMW